MSSPDRPLIPESWAVPVMAGVRAREVSALAASLASLAGRVFPSDADIAEATRRLDKFDDAALMELLLGSGEPE